MMGSEIEVPETPNWLQELEAKRERRLKARLGHEAGAGAPCLKCGDKCPGLDLHFWRKCCKICKCSKEEHEVQDDDIYGWAQFQLLGNKPNKIKKTIKLPGKKDEVELDWIPKGHNETIDKYLKTLPADQLPVKGSQAAQDRKQLLQKQIPIHDIDPTLCHELSNDELKQMNDYITHVKQSSVGVGQIVSLSNVIKAHLHMLNPSEAALIASRYPKGIPLSEIVKLQSQDKAHVLGQKLDKMSLKDATNKNIPNFVPSLINTKEDNLNPWVGNKVHDVNYPGYTKNVNQTLKNVQFSGRLKPGQNIDDEKEPYIEATLDERFMQNPNFDPKNIPSQFLHQNAQYGQPFSYKGSKPVIPLEGKLGGSVDENIKTSAPYDNKVSSVLRPGDKYIEENPSQDDPNLIRNLSKYPSGQKTFDSIIGNDIPYETAAEFQKNNLRGLPNYVPGKYNVFSENQTPTNVPKSVKDLAFSTYNPSDENVTIPNQDTSVDPIWELEHHLHGGYQRAPYITDSKLANENYPPEYLGSIGSKSGQYRGSNVPSAGGAQNVPYNQNKIPVFDKNAVIHENSMGLRPGEYASPLKRLDDKNMPPNFNPGQITYSPFDRNEVVVEDVTGLKPSEHTSPLKQPGNQNILPGYNPNAPRHTTNIGSTQNIPIHDENVPFNEYSIGLRPGEYARPSKLPTDQNMPPGYNPGNTSYSNVPVDDKNAAFDEHLMGLRPGEYTSPSKVPGGQHVHPGGVPYPNVPYNTRPTKKLSELHPGKLNIDEDYLQPSQVTIGAIQDINYPEIKAATQGTNDFYEDYSPDSLREILNNVKLPECHYCKKPFEENEFAIMIDRANVLFHAQCFKCAGCNQILADNVYFYNKETDNIYCGRDYAKIRGFPRCKACDELIFTKEYCLAENSTFHLKHFCCMECDKPLAGQDYTLEDEMPYCLPCFEQSKASKCNSCEKVIKPDEIGCNLKGVHFHATDDCFACKVCKKPLMGQKLLLRNDKLYCSHDCFGTDKI